MILNPLNLSFVIKLGRILLVTFLKHVFKEVHHRVIGPKQAVTEIEAQVATKIALKGILQD